MKVVRTEWSVQQYDGTGWHDRGLPYHTDDAAIEQWKGLIECFPDRQYRVVNIRWYTDTRTIADTDNE